jgi:C4-dicarboxylate-specific signal transduction histidine kinase
MQSEFQRHDVSLETQLLATLGSVKADPTQLQQVIVNLLTNAMEAISASTGSTRVLRVTTESDQDGGVLVNVEDSGTGIDSEVLDRIFDPMFTTKAQGMGLGLSICRSIVEGRGGRLRVSPNPAGGSIFRFNLPEAE